MTHAIDSSTDFTVNYYNPLLTGGGYRGRLTVNGRDYEHTTSLFGGYDTASIGTVVGYEEMDDWLESGLGRVIKVWDSDNEVVWEGFVNELQADLGGLQLTIGPLLNVANKVRVQYTLVDTGTNPPTPGLQKQTAWATDPDSITEYGALERVLSAEQLAADANATQIRDLYIKAYAWPRTNSTYLNETGSYGLALRCLGFYHWLETYTYTQTASSGLIGASTLLQNIISAEPNGFLARDFFHVAANSTNMAQYLNDNAPALNLVRSIVSHGDASLLRWLFGVYQNRTAHYEKAPTYVEYFAELGSKTKEIYAIDGAVVRPWQVRPGKWLRFTDLMIGHIGSSTLTPDAADPRVLFIERVTFRMPTGVTLQGGIDDSIDEKLARLGLRGVAI